MHRSRLPVLAIFAAAAACSTRGSTSDEGNDALSHDSTLVARLADDQPGHALPLPSSCGAIAFAARPTTARQHAAQELTRQALDAEIHGSIGDARSLLRRASELDGTNKSVAYHLGRTSEALHDSTSALAAYCRYLALGPTTAESAEARMRVARLTQRAAHAAPRSAVATSASRSTRVRNLTVASASRRQPLAAMARPRVAGSARRSEKPEQRTAPSGIYDTPTTNPSRTASSRADGGVSGAAGGEVVATSAPSPDVDPPESAPSSARRGPSSTQGALVGAAAGAIIGAATGRSVKSAVIGAAAGGILGTVVVRTSGPRRWSRR